MTKTKRTIIFILIFFAAHVLFRMMDNGAALGIYGHYVWGWTWDGWETELWRLAGTAATFVFWIAIALGFGWNLDALLKKCHMRQN
jgi:hypothetical protein